MDHVVFTDKKSSEMESLINGKKTIIIRGATGRKIPYGIVNKGDTLYLINNNGEGLVKAKCTVLSVFNSEKMYPEQSLELVNQNSDRLCLSDIQYKKWTKKRYLVLINVGEVREIDSFKIDKTKYSNMDDWLPVGDVEDVKIKS